MRKVLIPIAAALALATGGTPASAEEAVTELDRFRLWNDCQPMGLIVKGSDKSAAIKLTKEAIEIDVRGRLRAAGLYKADLVGSLLQVFVTGDSRSFAFSISYAKWLTDAVSGEAGFAGTWAFTGGGSHGLGSGYIRTHISQSVDQILDYYLWVNADACRNSN